MKKILSSLATIALISSSLINITALTKTTNHPVYTNHHAINQQRNGEDAEDIANKLWNKSFGMYRFIELAKILNNIASN